MSAEVYVVVLLFHLLAMEMIKQQRNILRALSQGGNEDGKDLEPVV